MQKIMMFYNIVSTYTTREARDLTEISPALFEFQHFLHSGLFEASSAPVNLYGLDDGIFICKCLFERNRNG